tara:strand:+ start:1560 stop:1946 length:387 start_codon:yes stop_codon:yes gene_type:complete
MSELSNYLENKFLNITLNNATALTVTTPYLALFTNDPTDAGSGTECNWSGYARQTMSFATATDGSAATDAPITFPAVSGSDVTVTHMGIFDASSSGNLLYHTILDASKTLSADDVMSFATGSATVTMS